MGQIALPANSTVLLDSMCVIYAVERVPPYVRLLRPVFTDIRAGRLACAISTVTLAEVLTKPLRDGDSALAGRFRRVLLRTRNVTLLPLDRAVAERAASLRARYSLRTPDAVQIGTAIEAGCTHVVTNDPVWKRVTELPILILKDILASP